MQRNGGGRKRLCFTALIRSAAFAHSLSGEKYSYLFSAYLISSASPDSNITPCEKLASPYARSSHRLMREARIALCEKFASPYARRSHRSMREVLIALYETFASLDTRHSYRSIREVRITRYRKFVSLHARRTFCTELQRMPRLLPPKPS